MTTPASYPKRQSHFAHRAVRLMQKCVLAQEIGPEVCWLLAVIAHQEDAKRYSGPVTFWNEQLAAIAGFSNVKKLDRSRQKAIDAGWLAYIPGTKGIPGKYWIVVPAHLTELGDGPIDETPEKHPGIMADSTPDSSPKSTKQVGKEPGKKRGISATEAGNDPGTKREEKRETSGQPSSLLLYSVNGLEEPPKVPQEDSFAERIYRAYPRKEGYRNALSKIEKALESISPAELLAAVEEFAVATKGCDPQFIPHPATWFYQERWNDDRTQWNRIGRDGKRAEPRKDSGTTFDPDAPPSKF